MVRLVGTIVAKSSKLARNVMSKCVTEEVNRHMRLDNNALLEFLGWVNDWQRFCEKHTDDLSTVGLKAEATKFERPISDGDCYMKIVAGVGVVCYRARKDVTRVALRNESVSEPSLTDGLVAVTRKAVDGVPQIAPVLSAIGGPGEMLINCTNVASMVLLPCDIFMLIKTIATLENGDCKMSAAIRKTADVLEEEMPRICHVDQIVRHITHSALSTKCNVTAIEFLKELSVTCRANSTKS